MSHGLQFFSSTGQLTFDSRDAVGGVVADVVSMAAGGGNLTKSYPDFPGRSAIVKAGAFDVPGSVDYALGYPRVTFASAAAFPVTWIVIIY